MPSLSVTVSHPRGVTPPAPGVERLTMRGARVRGMTPGDEGTLYPRPATLRSFIG